MNEEPYLSARRVFWVVDNGSSHRGQAAVERLARTWPRRPELILVHLPIHASWLNQVEIYLSIVQRKVLEPNDFDDLAAVEERLLAFQRHYQEIAQPFEWTFTRRDLDHLLERLSKAQAATQPRRLRPDERIRVRTYEPEHLSPSALEDCSGEGEIETHGPDALDHDDIVVSLPRRVS